MLKVFRKNLHNHSKLAAFQFGLAYPNMKEKRNEISEITVVWIYHKIKVMNP